MPGIEVRGTRMRDWRDGIRERVRADIARVGWNVTMVGGGGSSPPLAHTVGLSETFSHPEIFMVGFSPEMMHTLLNDAAAFVRDGAVFAAPCLFDKVVAKYDVAFRPVRTEDAAEVGKVASAVLGSFEAVQMFLPDERGNFPWDRKCDPSYAAIQTTLLEARGAIPTSRQFTPRPQ